MLTSAQKNTLEYIHARISADGIPPSFDEIRMHLGLKSKSGIHRVVEALVERGFIRRLPNRSRAIEVIKLPGNASISALARMPVVALSPPISHAIDSRTVSIPVMGRIAAGVPISAIQNHSYDIACPPDLLTSGEHFALEVRGDSMINAGIHDGDTVIIRRSDSAENGTIVVAVVDGEEATLKRIRKRGGAIALEPANPLYDTRIFGPDQIAVIGRLVGLMRRY